MRENGKPLVLEDRAWYLKGWVSCPFLVFNE